VTQDETELFHRRIVTSASGLAAAQCVALAAREVLGGLARAA
jgi:hypothetical protein